MATFFANQAININNIDLNFYVRTFFDSDFFDNQNISFNGIIYRDVAAVYSTTGYELYFGGPTITVDALGSVTGGTVTGLLEYDPNTSQLAWGIEGVSVSAADIYSSAFTASNADELNLVAQALSGSDTFYLSNESDVINGYAGNDVFFGNDGNDILIGGTGNDTYIVYDSDDTIIEGAGEGTIDRIAAGGDYVLQQGVYVELLTTTSTGSTAAIDLKGNTLSQTITGNAGGNFLNSGGSGGADILRGRGGSDKYRVHNSNDTVIEKAGEGNDRVITSVNYQLGNGVHVETLATNSSTGTKDLRLVGNTLVQTIIGNAGDNFISAGGQGTGDVLRGLAGNDIYRVYNASDTIIEAAGRGGDRVMASVNYALGAGVSIESLTTNRSAGTTAINLTGNELAQSIVGNAGKNVISDGGGAGADTLRGLKGSDIYIVRNSDTSIIENASEGTSDRISAAVDYDLEQGVQVESMTTTSYRGAAAIDLTGNSRSQTIIGNAGDNYLNSGGSASADVLRGSLGDDKYRVHNSSDKIFEYASEGNDRVITSVNYQLSNGVHVETLATNSSTGTKDLRLVGNTLVQTIIGNAGDNYISAGGQGTGDVLRGLAGNDIYRVYNASDTIIEAAGRGGDRVMASVNFALGAGVSIESLTTNGSAGTSDIDLTGNELSQSIVGNAGDNRINGGEGSDLLRGLGGEDTFVFDSALDPGNIDTVDDLNVADDQIELDNAIFNVLSVGTLAAGAFHSGSAAVDAGDRIIYDSTTGDLFYDEDGTGATGQVQFAILDPALALSNTDFDVI